MSFSEGGQMEYGPNLASADLYLLLGSFMVGESLIF